MHQINKHELIFGKRIVFLMLCYKLVKTRGRAELLSKNTTEHHSVLFWPQSSSLLKEAVTSFVLLAVLSQSPHLKRKKYILSFRYVQTISGLNTVINTPNCNIFLWTLSIDLIRLTPTLVSILYLNIDIWIVTFCITGDRWGVASWVWIPLDEPEWKQSAVHTSLKFIPAS